MRTVLVIGCAALAVSACKANVEVNNTDMNATATDDMALDQNATGGMDANIATNATTENAMMNDLTHNDVDTNLANGQ